ncbi:F0F1 ATP synthase subunit A [Actinomyces sp. 186855]|nr:MULTISPECIES: F0F1 ATP synthase subunit A [unclassified Actinomyces]MCL3777657.1 F0F1 ATP synthase subunit A [Actinomyces sp. AC-20-1]MCL3789761.1 F0F1 ATP synthase subunit A [Actinomyces sp. 187325]MCL3791956.1 F0F1 ATP synthase subunit A [Actinomyces sp. 186855]MCL3794618.1 F0F1 ATP synthase subunit A [Actinomyces sp. 217892]
MSDAGGFTPPSIDDFYPEPFAFLGTPLEMNRVMMVRMLMAVALVLVFGIGASRARLVPGRLQNILEMLIGFVRVNIAEEILGKKHGTQYAPVLTTMFLGILFLNISGVIPGLQIASTGVVGMPLVFALVSYVVFIYAGIRANGVGRFLKGTVLPSGVPGFLAPLIIPIEFLSNLVLRPLTLTIRLMANMISGHLLLSLCFIGTNFLFVYASAELKAVGVVTLAAGIAFILLESFIAALQAYIFTLLTAVYIESSVHVH